MANKINPKRLPDERKVYRGVSMEPYYPEDGIGLEPGIYFMALEELQGAWIDGEWEEADGGTLEWDEEYTDDDGRTRFRTVTQEVLRSRRYVLKRFITEDNKEKNEFKGQVVNAFKTEYTGPRQYKA